MTRPQILYLNGPSSSGKSTLAKALQDVLDPPHLHVGIDKIIGMMPFNINNWEGGEAPEGFSWKKIKDKEGVTMYAIQMGPFAQKVSMTYKKVVETLASEGHPLIIDDVDFGKEAVDAWKKCLSPFSVVWIGIIAKLSDLEKREKERGDRILGSARHQYYTCHQGVEYDLTINTSKLTLQECVAAIQSHLKLNL